MERLNWKKLNKALYDFESNGTSDTNEPYIKSKRKYNQFDEKRNQFKAFKIYQ